jgi:hypothetical protein
MTTKEEYERRKADKQAKEEKKISESWWWGLKDPVTLFTGVLAIVAIFQLMALNSTDTATHDLAGAAAMQAKAAKEMAEGIGGQLTAMRGQLDEMKTQRLVTTAQLRANLRRETPSITPLGEGGQLFAAGDNLTGWEIRPVWTNVGSTSARDFRGWVEMQTFTFSIGKKNGPDDCPIPVAPDPLPQGTVIAQGGSVQTFGKTLSVIDAMKAKDKSATTAIFMYGHVEYRDMLDVRDALGREQGREDMAVLAGFGAGESRHGGRLWVGRFW